MERENSWKFPKRERKEIEEVNRGMNSYLLVVKLPLQFIPKYSIFDEDKIFIFNLTLCFCLLSHLCLILGCHGNARNSFEI